MHFSIWLTALSQYAFFRSAFVSLEFVGAPISNFLHDVTSQSQDWEKEISGIKIVRNTVTITVNCYDIAFDF